MALTKITEKGIKDGEIINADINASADIALSKLDTSGTANNGTFLRGDGAWTAVSTDLVGDTSPQLGGNLDGNGFEIALDGDKAITFDGKGNIEYKSSQFQITNSTGDILIDNNASGGDTKIYTNTDFEVYVDDGDAAIKAIKNGSVELYEAGTKRFETSNTGATVTGNITATKLLSSQSAGSAGLGFGDNVQIHLGNSDDLKIYHNGTHSYIQDSGQGGINLDTNNLYIRSASGSETLATFNEDGAVELYHGMGGSAAEKKFETTSGGVEVFGELQMDDANSHIKIPDNARIDIGTGNDLRIYHDGNNSRIEDQGDGYLAIRSNNIRFENPAANQALLYIQENAGVDLYHANTRRFRTLDTGAAVTGGLSIDGSGVNNASGQDAALHVTTDVNDWAAIFQKSTEYGVKIDSPNGATLAFALYNGATQKLAIAGDGKITATNNLAFASGKGIDFSATSDASGNSSELFDDYEEGTFTPRLGGDQNHSNYNVTGSGWYTKVGRKVDCQIAFNNIDLHGASSGTVMITGLPFSSNSGMQPIATTDHYLFNIGFNTSRIQSWYIGEGDNKIYGIESLADSSWSSWAVGNFQGSSRYVRLHVVYYV